jgi:hypothetical protein
MFLSAFCFTVAALPLYVFGYWGCSTKAGRRRFDEMAGIIPSAARALGILFALVACILWLIYALNHEPYDVE